MPDARFTTPILLVYSADLIARVSSGTDAGVCYGTTGTAPNRKFVVTWKDSFFYDANEETHLTFSATLNEGTNVIDVVLENIEASGETIPEGMEEGAVAALGTQAGTSSDSFSCHQPSAPEGTVIHYTP